MNDTSIIVVVLIGAIGSALGILVATFLGWLWVTTTGKVKEWNEYGDEIDELREQQEAVLEFIEGQILTGDDEQIGKLTKKVNEIRALRRAARERDDEE